jgi:hypothetical protein
MKDKINDIRNKIIGKLNALVESSEEIYLNLGKDYPLLLKELDNSVKKSSSIIENFNGSGGSLKAVDQIINEGNSIIENFNNSFTSLYSRDGELFDIIKRGVAEISSLEKIINNIKDGSIEMELISLNAMTVALKSGTAGKALSFITDELKKLSAQTIRLTDELTIIGKNQLNLFEEFGGKIEKARTNQEALTENISLYLKSSFTTTSQTLRESSQMMSSLSGSSREVKEPLMRIMQEVQLQDIIRQSIDHIYISIDELKMFNEDWTEEENRDELSFRKMMPDLCFSVLEDVKSEITESCSVFEENSLKVKSILDSLESKRVSFIESVIGTSSDSGFGILAQKKEANDRINSLIQEVQNSIKLRLEISSEGSKLLKDITILKRQFELFEPIITRFHNIIVASRIEVSKQSALSDMKDTVTKMTQLTESINQDISNALDTIKHFLKTTQSIIQNYSNIIKREMPGLKSQITRTSDNLYRLDDISDLLIRCLTDFNIFNSNFLHLLKRTDENRKDLVKLNDNIMAVESLLHLIKESANTDIFKLNSSLYDSKWTIKNERLNNILDKFTIFTHKKTARDLAGGQEASEQAADSGDVTLF